MYWGSQDVVHCVEKQLQVSDRRQPTECQTRGRVTVEWEIWGRLLVKIEKIQKQRPRRASRSAGSRRGQSGTLVHFKARERAVCADISLLLSPLDPCRLIGFHLTVYLASPTGRYYDSGCCA